MVEFVNEDSKNKNMDADNARQKSPSVKVS